MQNRLVLGVSLGVSFAEFSLIQNPVSLGQMRVLGQKRSYLPRESLKQSLTQFLETHKNSSPSQIFLSLGYLERLFDLRLGNTVAQIVTEGFEHWSELRSQKSTGPALASPDLIFPVRERMTAQGKIHTPLNLAELASISAKLKVMECKRVCIHFLHAGLNNLHETQAADFFQQEGFEVFVPQKTDNPDEVSRWRKNVLNASVSGTFAELKSEIIEAAQGQVSAENIFFLDGEGRLFQNENGPRASTIFAATSAMAKVFQKDQADLLYLGLENFVLLKTKRNHRQWKSPWGQIEAHHTGSLRLSIQPTSSIKHNDFNLLNFAAKAEGWEPGPMLMGRGQKGTLLDLWGNEEELRHIEGLKDRIVASGSQRFKNSLLTLWKNCRLRDTEMDQVSRDLRNLAVQTVALEASLHRDQEKLIVTGPLTPLFAEVFQKDEQVQVLHQDFIESIATAVGGLQAWEAQ